MSKILQIAIMENEALNDLDAKGKILLVALASHSDDDGTNCYPGQRRLMARTRLGESTLRRTIKKIEKAGYIAVTSGNGKKHPSSYELNLDRCLSGKGVQAEPLNAAKGSKLNPFGNSKGVQTESKGVQIDAERGSNGAVKGSNLNPNSYKNSYKNSLEETPRAREEGLSFSSKRNQKSIHVEIARDIVQLWNQKADKDLDFNFLPETFRVRLLNEIAKYPNLNWWNAVVDHIATKHKKRERALEAFVFKKSFQRQVLEDVGLT